MVHEGPMNRDGKDRPDPQPGPGQPEDLLAALCRKLGDGIECGSQAAKVLAGEVAAALLPGDWLFLEGDLGAGKTTFVQWLLGPKLASSVADGEAGLDAGSFVTSPTYSLCHGYDAPSELGDRFRSVIHMDLYRMQHDREVFYLGLDELISRETLVVVEWAEQVSQQGWRQLWFGLDCGAPQRLIQLSIAWADHANAVQDEKRRYRICVLPT